MVQSSVDRIAPKDRGAAAQPENKTPVATTTANTVEQLTRYIPSEIITVYVALTSAMENAKASVRALWIGFAICLALTPVVTWLIFAAKVRARGQAIPRSWRVWPYWKIFAAIVAFVAWATALPHGPFWTVSWFNPSYGAVALLGTTALLGLLGGIYEPLGEE